MNHHHQISHAPPPPPPPTTTHLERRWKPHLEKAPNCPRCASATTKFCYYNNYSLSQPRYFCKSCRRYFTKGGSLRNVPLGGASRKTRRPKPSSSSAAVPPHPTNTQSSSSSSDGSDIDIAAVFARFLNTEPQSSTTASPESADPFQNLTAEDSQISLEELSDLFQVPKQGIAEDYETLPFGLQSQLSVQDFEYFSSNYNNANHLRVSDQFCGDNWVNNIDFF